MTKYKVSKELPHSRGNIDYDTIYIKPNYGEYDQSTDIVKFDKKDGSLWAVMRTGKFLTFQHKKGGAVFGSCGSSGSGAGANMDNYLLIWFVMLVSKQNKKRKAER